MLDRPMAAAVAEASPGVDVAPLEPIEPISMAPLATESIVPSRIVIASLDPIAELHVAPLTPRLERD